MKFAASSRILGLFEKRIDGDDALLELARARFSRSGLGAEFYAASPEELNRLMQFKPANGSPCMAHLPRWIDLLDERGRRQVLSYAEDFSGKLYGLNVHDQPEIDGRFDDYLAALNAMEIRLEQIPGSPLLFVEYASGLDPELFVGLFHESRHLRRISCCVDTGHVGIWQVRRSYSLKHAGVDVCSMRPSDRNLPDLVGEVQGAVRSALATLTKVIRELGRLGKPVHFHLHDGHPLSTFNRFGVSDHLSFRTRIPIPFEYVGALSLPTMYGPEGLKRIIGEAMSSSGPDMLSFTLEIHPTGEELDLDGEDARLFAHWRDKRNAYRMNHWLAVLEENAGEIRGHNAYFLRK